MKEKNQNEKMEQKPLWIELDNKKMLCHQTD